MAPEQSYANHTRWHPLHHYVVTPLLLVHLAYVVSAAIRQPSIDRADDVLVALVLIMISVLARTYPLRVQDRVIRLEEQLRIARVVPANLAERAADLTAAQFVAQ